MWDNQRGAPPSRCWNAPIGSGLGGWRSGLVSASNVWRLGLLTVQDCRAELLEQGLGEHSVGILTATAGNGSQIVARPREPIEFVQPKPMSLAVEPERSADLRRDFEGVGLVGRWRVGDRRHDHRY